MAQLRQDYHEFTKRGAEIIALGPDGPRAYQRFWESEDMPFIGMPDIKSKIAERYYQEVNWLKLGRLPAMFVIDRDGMIRYKHYASSMSDIPENEEIIKVIEQINEEKDE